MNSSEKIKRKFIKELISLMEQEQLDRITVKETLSGISRSGLATRVQVRW